LDRSISDAAVATAILSLGESLGANVTAEGVERTAQLEWLRRRGCHEAQRFLLSKPLAARDLEDQFLRTVKPALDSVPSTLESAQA
jgi:EAL domain-containing protein (putative c-di-GMP-specific phosphodiesterase class I)